MCTNHLTNATYDANGNQTSSPGFTRYYDTENRMTVQYATSWPYPDSFYGYDPMGKRVMKEANPDAQNLNTGSNPLFEFYIYGITGQRLVTVDCDYSWHNTLPNCWVVGQNIYFGSKLLVSNGVNVATDRLGSVRANTQGERFAYYPYGEERTSTVDWRDRFTTYFRDGVGQDYADQRYYNSSMGRFWTGDPGGIKTADSSDPGSWNRYAYVRGDPVNSTDRHGLIVCVGCGGDDDDDDDDDDCGYWFEFLGYCPVGVGPIGPPRAPSSGLKCAEAEDFGRVSPEPVMVSYGGSKPEPTWASVDYFTFRASGGVPPYSWSELQDVASTLKITLRSGRTVQTNKAQVDKPLFMAYESADTSVVTYEDTPGIDPAEAVRLDGRLGVTQAILSSAGQRDRLDRCVGFVRPNQLEQLRPGHERRRIREGGLTLF